MKLLRLQEEKKNQHIALISTIIVTYFLEVSVFYRRSGTCSRYQNVIKTNESLSRDSKGRERISETEQTQIQQIAQSFRNSNYII